jgi:hypothetical protein
MGDWKSSEDGVTKDSNKKKRPPMTGGVYRTEMSTTIHQPKFKEMEYGDYKKIKPIKQIVNKKYKKIKPKQ